VEGMLVATATAFGGMKQEAFIDYVKKFERNKVNAVESLESMKKDGLPIEEN
jgi:hypothetical protein